MLVVVCELVLAGYLLEKYSKLSELGLLQILIFRGRIYMHYHRQWTHNQVCCGNPKQQPPLNGHFSINPGQPVPCPLVPEENLWMLVAQGFYRSDVLHAA